MKLTSARITILFLLCLLLVAFVAAMLVPSPGGHEQSKRTATIADIQSLKGMVKDFRSDNLRLPTDKEGLDALVHCPPDLKSTWKGPYADRIPADKWGTPYRYELTPPPATGIAADDEGFNITSAGKDQQFGTDDDVDIYTEK